MNIINNLISGLTNKRWISTKSAQGDAEEALISTSVVVMVTQSPLKPPILITYNASYA